MPNIREYVSFEAKALLPRTEQSGLRYYNYIGFVKEDR